MTFEIITGRFETERFVEDLFINDRPRIDYADIQIMKRISTLKYGILINLTKEAFMDDVIKTIKSSIPIPELKTYFVHICANEKDSSLVFEMYDKIGNIIRQIEELKTSTCPDERFDGLFSFSCNHSMSLGECHINLVYGVNKTEKDKLEDDKYERLIKEYRESKMPQIGLDIFKCFIDDNNEK